MSVFISMFPGMETQSKKTDQSSFILDILGMELERVSKGDLIFNVGYASISE